MKKTINKIDISKQKKEIPIYNREAEIQEKLVVALQYSKYNTNTVKIITDSPEEVSKQFKRLAQVLGFKIEALKSFSAIKAYYYNIDKTTYAIKAFRNTNPLEQNSKTLNL